MTWKYLSVKESVPDLALNQLRFRMDHLSPTQSAMAKVAMSNQEVNEAKQYLKGLLKSLPTGIPKPISDFFDYVIHNKRFVNPGITRGVMYWFDGEIPSSQPLSGVKRWEKKIFSTESDYKKDLYEPCASFLNELQGKNAQSAAHAQVTYSNGSDVTARLVVMYPDFEVKS